MGTQTVKRILYATDLSDNARVAGDYALQLSNDCQAHLTIVSVVPDEAEEMSVNMGYDLAAHYDSETLESFSQNAMDQRREELIERINNLCSTMKNRSIDNPACPKISIKFGDPVEQILLEAKSDGADLIVLGARGHSLLDDILIGSVANGVVKKSLIPVVTVPQVES